MSYCRFRNTLLNLRDCEDSMEDELIDDGYDSEYQARIKLIKKCYDIVQPFLNEDDSLDEDSLKNLPKEK